MDSRNAEGVLPRFQIDLLDGSRFAYSSDEFEALKIADEEMQKARHEKTLASIPSAEITPEMQIFRPARLHFIELYEEDYLDTLIQSLKVFGFNLHNYFYCQWLFSGSR